MFRFRVRSLLALLVALGVVLGCGPRKRHQIETIKQGVSDVTKHAHAIEEAAQPAQSQNTNCVDGSP